MQSKTQVVFSLLKQFLSQLSNIPRALEALYDECTKYQKPDREMTKLTEFLLTWSQQLQVLTFGVFDAFDECDDSTQKDLLSFFGDLQKHGWRLLISSRPHVQGIETLDDSLSLEIRADEVDIKHYILHRFKLAKNSKAELLAGCLALGKGVDGMYKTQLWIRSSLVGFFLPNIKWITSSM